MQEVKKTVFEYLIEQESLKPGLMFGPSKDGSLFISYPGYKHMDLFEVREELQQTYGLRFDFSRPDCTEQFDQVCGRTFVYFKDVYKEAI